MLRFSFVKAKAKPRLPNRNSASCPPASASESPRAFLHTVFACFDCISFWLGFKKKKNLREVCRGGVSDQGRFAHTVIHCIGDSFVSAKNILL